MALAFSAQAGVLRLHAGNHHQIKKHQVANPVITQSQAMELQTQQFYQPQRVITSMPEGEYLMYTEDADLGVQPLWGHSIIYQDKDGYYMYEYFIDDVDAIRYQIDGDNLYLLGCEGDPNAEFPDYYNATGLLGHFSDGSNMTCLEYVGPGVPYGTLLNLRPAVPANPTNVTWQDRRWHSPAA